MIWREVQWYLNRNYKTLLNRHESKYKSEVFTSKCAKEKTIKAIDRPRL